MSDYYKNPRPTPAKISDKYKKALENGYFDDNGALRIEFIQEFSKEIAQLLCDRKMTSTQLRNFYSHVKRACTIYKLNKDSNMKEAILLGKVKKLDSIVKYNMGRDNTGRDNMIPWIFGDFIALNLDACGSAKDITDGFAPHFETIVGYFKFYEKRRSGK